MEATKLTDLQIKLEHLAQRAEDRNDWPACDFWTELARVNRSVSLGRPVDERALAEWSAEIAEIEEMLG